MGNKSDGGPAFPHTLDMVSGGNSRGGMSLRDYFAGQALPAVIAAYTEANGRCIGTDHVKYNCAAHAYQFADAMLAERNKPGAR